MITRISANVEGASKTETAMVPGGAVVSDGASSAAEMTKSGGDRKKKKSKKEAVLVRFERGQLAQIDARAASLGLNRAAWLRMAVAWAQMDEQNRGITS